MSKNKSKIENNSNSSDSDDRQRKPLLGKYDVDMASIENDGVTGTVPIVFSNHKTGVLSDVAYLVTLQGKSYLNETYKVIMNDRRGEQIGFIEFVGLYLVESSDGIISPPGVITFDVTTRSGAFKRIKKVSIDFSNQIRRVKFFD